jgi:hypothetical protein
MSTTRLAFIASLAILCAPNVALAHGHGGGHHASRTSGGVTHVRSYTKKNGTVVEAHDRTAEGGAPGNNWSTKGNVNPETGKPGDKQPATDH